MVKNAHILALAILLNSSTVEIGSPTSRSSKFSFRVTGGHVLGSLRRILQSSALAYEGFLLNKLEQCVGILMSTACLLRQLWISLFLKKLRWYYCTTTVLCGGGALHITCTQYVVWTMLSAIVCTVYYTQNQAAQAYLNNTSM